MRLLLTRAKLLAEGSGAAATAALLSGRVRAPAGARVVAIVSGGNVDLEKVPWGG
jgi:threonine dehydratase